MTKNELENVIKEMADLGMCKRVSPSKIIISPYLLKVAESIAEKAVQSHEIKVNFDE